MLQATIVRVWSDAEVPLRSLTAPEWLEMFAAAGYTDCGKPSPRPAEPLRLWRGAPYKYHRRWSWTADFDRAQRFADRSRGRVWSAVVPPFALLGADAGHEGRNESEYVVNTTGLTIQSGFTGAGAYPVAH
ncbi:MAG TPA: hypothetical protein VLU92_10600 [Candidatus Dormibacteraeota bacterium]|nr:hypothetical protein [Candidatus Dormibacteraeota bacterium]